MKPHPASSRPPEPSAAPERTDVPPAPADAEDMLDQELRSTRVIEGAAAADEPQAAPQAAMGLLSKGPVRLGDFELLRKLGEGAMGAVYLARQISFDREVALKVLFRHVANNPKLVERLYREGRAMG